MLTTTAAVQALARYPVKSTAGELLASAQIDLRGVHHDRTWAVYTADGGIGSGKTTRRFRRIDGLMAWRSSMDDAGSPLLHRPDGVVFDVQSAADALSTAFGQPLTVQAESDVSHFDDCAVHVVTTASLRAVEQLVGADVDVRRARANIVLHVVGTDVEGTGFVEDDWRGRELTIGAQVVLRLGPAMPRCVMVDRAQHEVAADAPILKALGRAHGTELGLMAHVLRPGRIDVGDTATLR